MRSRYSAYATEHVDYLLRTWLPQAARGPSASTWHDAVPCHVHPARAARRPRRDEQVRPARQALDLPWSHWL